MQRTVIGVFSTESEAERAVRALHDSGFTEQEISLVSKDKGQGKTGGGGGGGRGGGGMGRDSQTSMRQDNVGDGVTSGAAWGGLAGLALGAGAIAIPGLGPIVAAGPIAAALTGAATGGLAGGYSTGAFRRRGAANYRRKSVKARFLPCLGAVTAKWTALRRYWRKRCPRRRIAFCHHQ